MSYVKGNPKSKAELRRWMDRGQRPRVFQPGGVYPLKTGPNGEVSLEGPHYPHAHTWYAEGKVDTWGYLVSIK